MLQIIVTILKVGGIILGIILAAALILLMLVLFVPIRYELKGKKREELQASGRVSWLFHIITLQVFYEEDMKMVLRIFGVPIWKS